ncbi:DUF881 domain-containing protein [Janibacter sp. G1551]|uniref:DUF881 domain-containing protein n=1 Tax=Janibacter sp. G1551 TaxID=3420440 RepID=UPI003D0057C3
MPVAEAPAEEAPAEQKPTASRSPAATSSRQAWRRLARMGRPRATRANFLALCLALLLGFAIATQVRATQQQGLEDLREDELVRILDDVSQDANRLDDEIAELRQTRDALRSANGEGAAAEEAARERLDTLGVLGGTRPATGPGITMTITDPDGEISAANLLDTVQELRDAGAEVIQIGTVRVVTSTWFSDDGGTVRVSGEALTRPFTFTVIGDPDTMASALEIPGGVAETVRGKGGNLTVTPKESVTITALHSIREPQYAQPVTDPARGSRTQPTREPSGP